MSEHVLILTPVKEAARHLDRYFHALESLTYEPDLLSIGLLASDIADGTFERLDERRLALEARCRRVTLVRRDFGFQIPDGVPRWAPALQLERRVVPGAQPQPSADGRAA
jgi:Anp1